MRVYGAMTVADAGPLSTDNVENTSTASGTTMTEALDGLAARAPTTETGALQLTANTPVDVRAWPIPDGQRISVSLIEFSLEADDDGAIARGGVYSGLGRAGRVGAGVAVLMGSATRQAENIPSDQLDFYVAGNELRLRYRANVTASSVPYTLRYSLTTQGAATP